MLIYFFQQRVQNQVTKLSKGSELKIYFTMFALLKCPFVYEMV